MPLLLCFSIGSAEAFSGSVGFHVNQRAFNDERFGSMNGFSDFKPEFELRFGLHEFYPRIEPLLSVAYQKNSATACAVEADGFTCLPADQQVGNQDRFEYKILSLGTGAQWKAWEPDYFPIIPTSFVQVVYRRVWIEKVGAAADELGKAKGGDLGFDFGGGVLISFMYDQRRKSEMSSEWGVKDFGLQIQARYILAGLLKSGMAGVTGTGGWSLGVGLLVDW